MYLGRFLLQVQMTKHSRTYLAFKVGLSNGLLVDCFLSHRRFLSLNTERGQPSPPRIIHT